MRDSYFLIRRLLEGSEKKSDKGMNENAQAHFCDVV